SLRTRSVGTRLRRRWLLGQPSPRPSAHASFGRPYIACQSGRAGGRPCLTSVTLGLEDFEHRRHLDQACAPSMARTVTMHINVHRRTKRASYRSFILGASREWLKHKSEVQY